MNAYTHAQKHACTMRAHIHTRTYATQHTHTTLRNTHTHTTHTHIYTFPCTHRAHEKYTRAQILFPVHENKETNKQTNQTNKETS